MNTLVTGGNGFIGRRLVSELLRRGEQVHVLDLADSSTSMQNSERLKIFSGSILNAVDVDRAMQGCDRVYHLAGYARNWAPDEQTFFDVNVGGTKQVLESAMKNNIKTVVHTSSNVTLGPSNGTEVDELTQRPNEFLTPYEKSKYLSECLVRNYVTRGLDVVIVNPSRVFGPGPLTESNSVTKMMAWYREGKWRLLLGDGRMVGNYVYINDLVAGYIRAMDYGRPGQNYILGGENVSFNDFFRLLLGETKRRYRMLHLPSTLAVAFSEFEALRSKYTRHYPLITCGWARTFLTNWANSCDKARRELGYVITPLREAMRETFEWLDQTANAV